MPNQLKISVGKFSDKGRKEINQDFHGAYIPEEPLLSSKGWRLLCRMVLVPAMSARLPVSHRLKAFWKTISVPPKLGQLKISTVCFERH